MCVGWCNLLAAEEGINKLSREERNFPPGAPEYRKRHRSEGLLAFTGGKKNRKTTDLIPWDSTPFKRKFHIISPQQTAFRLSKKNVLAGRARNAATSKFTEPGTQPKCPEPRSINLRGSIRGQRWQVAGES
ncbi:uncharacterized protein LOC129756974 [Uranotaenia lowii]|nr:uncharacterized protein LOC129756974 [Uranotaenia lowii]